MFREGDNFPGTGRVKVTNSQISLECFADFLCRVVSFDVVIIIIIIMFGKKFLSKVNVIAVFPIFS